MIGGAIFLSPRDTLVVLVPVLIIYFVHWNIISIAYFLALDNVDKFWYDKYKLISIKLAKIASIFKIRYWN